MVRFMCKTIPLSVSQERVLPHHTAWHDQYWPDPALRDGGVRGT